MSRQDLDRCQASYGLTFEGTLYIRYEAVLRLLQYDNHTEQWVLKFKSNDPLALDRASEAAPSEYS